MLAPCALGGLLNEETIPRLRCRIVAGAANNQLADYELAEPARRRSGILWAPDFVANAGGLINCAAERGGYSAARATAGVRAIGATLERIFDDAQAIGASPLTAAMELARRRLTALAERRPARTGRAGARPPRAAGPRPSSLSRWAASVTAAAGRRFAGASLQTSASSSSTVRRPRSERRDQAGARARGGGRCTARASPRGRAPAGRGRGRSDRAPAPQRLEAAQVARERSGVGVDEHAALTEHRVAGERHPVGDEGEVVRERDPGWRRR